MRVVFGLPLSHLWRAQRRIRGHSNYTLALLGIEVAGNLVGPVALWRSRRRVRRLGQRYGGQRAPGWQPLDAEKPLADYTPAVEVPDTEAVRAAIVVPEVPEEVPAVAPLLRQFAEQSIDPWALVLPE